MGRGFLGLHAIICLILFSVFSHFAGTGAGSSVGPTEHRSVASGRVQSSLLGEDGSRGAGGMRTIQSDNRFNSRSIRHGHAPTACLSLHSFLCLFSLERQGKIFIVISDLHVELTFDGIVVVYVRELKSVTSSTYYICKFLLIITVVAIKI